MSGFKIDGGRAADSALWRSEAPVASQPHLVGIYTRDSPLILTDASALQPARKSACPGAKERRFEPHYDAHYDGGREADLVLWRSEAPDLSGIYTRNSPPIFTDASALQPARKSACSRAKERMFEPQRRPCSRPAPAPRPFAPVRARALTQASVAVGIPVTLLSLNHFWTTHVLIHVALTLSDHSLKISERNREKSLFH